MIIASVALLLTLPFGRRDQEPESIRQTFVLGYQQKSIEPKTLEKLQRCISPSELDQQLRPLGLKAESHGKELTFVFPSNERLEFYIKMKKVLMDLFVKYDVGNRSKPIEKGTRASELPEYWFDQLTKSVGTTANTKISKSSQLLLRTNCDLKLEGDGREISIHLPLDRPVGHSLMESMVHSAAVEGGVQPSEKHFPATMEEGVREYPYVSFTLNGLQLMTWGSPFYNSSAAKVYEDYFHELRVRTEDAEKRLGQLHRDYMAAIGRSEPLWKELSDCKGKKLSDSSSELRQLVRDLIGASSKAFGNDDQMTAFLASATITSVRPYLSVQAPIVNHKGSFSLFGCGF